MFPLPELGFDALRLEQALLMKRVERTALPRAGQGGTASPNASRRARWRPEIAGLLALAFATVLLGPFGAQAETETPNGATLPPILTDYGEAWSSGDPERVVAIYADDALFEEVVLNGVVIRGHDELRSYAAAVFAAFPDFEIRATAGFASGEHVASEWILTGTYTGQFGDLPPGTGQRVEVRGASVIELAGGQIRRDSGYWDAATLLAQVGALPGPPTPQA